MPLVVPFSRAVNSSLMMCRERLSRSLMTGAMSFCRRGDVEGVVRHMVNETFIKVTQGVHGISP